MTLQVHAPRRASPPAPRGGQDLVLDRIAVIDGTIALGGCLA
jgi:hypothetical protein